MVKQRPVAWRGSIYSNKFIATNNFTLCYPNVTRKCQTCQQWVWKPAFGYTIIPFLSHTFLSWQIGENCNMQALIFKLLYNSQRFKLIFNLIFSYTMVSSAAFIAKVLKRHFYSSSYSLIRRAQRLLLIKEFWLNGSVFICTWMVYWNVSIV